MFSISYEWNNVTKYSTYRSDFWLPHKGLFIEVKGLWRDEYVVKFRAFQKQYPTVLVEVWDKTILIQKGIRTGHIIQGEFDEGDIRRNRHDARAE